MKILFLTGGAEPQMDGVGDYVVYLAKCLRANFDVNTYIVALNDKQCNDLKERKENDVGITQVPEGWKWRKKLSYVRKLILDFNPDVISIQFVIFGYQDKGLPFQISGHFEFLTKGFKVELMFHEIWVGAANNSSFKIRLWGFLQKQIIKRLIKAVKPVVIHTQSSLYLSKLEQLGYKITKLPLFATIQNFGKKNNIDGDVKKMIFFGSLHAEADVKSLSIELQKISHKIPVEIIYVGRNGSELNRHKEILDKYHIRYEILGRLSEEDISSYLNAADLGIGTGNFQLADKSSVITSMLLHKLPVLFIGYIARDINIEDFKSQGFYSLDDLDEILKNKPIFDFQNTLENVSAQFLNDICI